MNLNKGISTPIAILLIVACAVLAGVIIWQYKDIESPEPKPVEPQATTSKKSAWECGDEITFTYQGKEVTYGTVSYDGECWMGRNLGADSAAKAIDDRSAYGDLFQWGRCADGHQDRKSAIYQGPVSTSICNRGNDWDGKFVAIGFNTGDWVDSRSNDGWQEDGTGVNNPCPEGWRIPTKSEWSSASDSWSDGTDAVDSALKLSFAGSRFRGSGGLNGVGDAGFYWSSTMNRPTWYLVLNSNDVYVDGSSQATAHSIRCLRNSIIRTGQIIVTGHEPFTHLVLKSQDEKYLLTGSLKDELWELQTNTVTVEGNLIDKSTINVTSYEVTQ